MVGLCLILFSKICMEIAIDSWLALKIMLTFEKKCGSKLIFPEISVAIKRATVNSPGLVEGGENDVRGIISVSFVSRSHKQCR